MAFYKKVTVERETPQLLADRLRLRAIHAQARQERDALWPTLTPDNCVQAAHWLEDRITHLLKETPR